MRIIKLNKKLALSFSLSVGLFAFTKVSALEESSNKVNVLNSTFSEEKLKNAELYIKAGQIEEATRALQSALELAPNKCTWCDDTAAKLTKLIASKLILAINSGDFDTIHSYTKDNIEQATLDRIGLEMYAGYLAAESHFHGTFQLRSAHVTESTEELVYSEVFVDSQNTNTQYRIELNYTNAFPQKITRIRIRAQARESESQVDYTEANAISNLASYIDYLAKSDVFSGVVLVAKNDEVLLEKAVGKASKRFNINNNVNTQFNLGSMNKMFTSVATLKLVETGKLSLEDKLVNVLPIKKANKLGDIEIQHLLSHTSGIGSLNCQMGDFSITASSTDCFEKLASAQVNFKAGTQYRYSSDGMFILGLVLEHLMGESYYKVVNELVFEPANMTRTASIDLQFPVENAAIGYTFNGKHNSWQNNLFIHDKKGGPAGGGYSTAKDMFKFARALTTYTILNESLTRLAITPKVEFNADNYGFGFIVWERGGRHVIGHNGSFPGVSSQLEIHLESGYTIVVLSNHSFGADPVLNRAHELLKS